MVLIFFVNYRIRFIIIILPVLISVAFITLLERKILGFSQLRVGPNKVSALGLLQPFADAIKLFLKQQELNFNSYKFIYQISPIIIIILIIILWGLIIPLSLYNIIDISTLWIVIILRIGVYPLLLRGWASNRKYAILGAIRGVAQTISYEIRLALVLITFILFYVSFKLKKFSLYLSVIFFIPIIITLWLTIRVAETNRTPFDFAEGESELVSGFNIEYGSIGFVLIFLTEYSIIFLFSGITSLILGTPVFSLIWTLLRIFLVAIWIILRATFPRYRYDLLINLAWKRFLPETLAILIIFLRILA